MNKTPAPLSGPLPEQTGRPAPESLLARRAGARAMAATYPEAEIHLDGGAWGQVRALRFAPCAPAAIPAAAARPTVLHWHGGGFRLGSPEYAGVYARNLADACAVDVVCPEYRLAPEHPFPAALNDGMAAITALRGGGPLILAGDSAGGGVAAGLALLCARQGIPLAGLVLHSPWLDLTVSSPCFAANAASDPLFSAAAAREGAEQYLQGHSAQDPLASPVFADVAAFPPTYISVGAGEVLADDSLGLHARLAAAGRPVHLTAIAGMEHVAVMRGNALVGAEQTFAEVAAFIRDLARPSVSG